MRALVTGGASVVGSHLCDRLLAEGLEVLAVDDLSTGSFANVSHLERDPRFALVEHDVAGAFDAHVDLVYHLALPSTPEHCERSEVKAAMTCVAGTKHVLEAAAARGARVVMASSTARFGEGVRCAEAIARAIAKDRGLDVRYVRVPSTYGPRMAPDDGQLVTRLVLEGLFGPTIAAPDDVTVRLSWALDVVETLVRAMAVRTSVPPVIAPHVDATAFAIAEAIGRATGTPVSVLAGAARPLPSARAHTITEAFPASIVFGLEPSVDLVVGIAATVMSFAARIGKRSSVRASALYAKGPS